MLYSKLSETAQERARAWYRENCLDHEWWDSEYDHWKEKLAELGFSDPDIRHSGFCCQGDGASFTAKVTREFKLPAAGLQRIEEATAVAKVNRRFAGLSAHVDLFYDLSFRIERDIHDRYVHPYTIRAEYTLNVGDDVPEDISKMLETWADELRNGLTQEARDLSDQIYRSLETEWDYLNSDEAIAESIEANDWSFNEDGDHIPRARRKQLAAA